MANLFWDVPFVVLIFIAHFVTAVIPYYTILLFGFKKFSSRYLYSVTRFYAKLLLKSAGVKLHTSIDSEAEKLIEKQERICFVSNHTSLFDTPAIFLATRAELGFIVKRSIAFTPFLNMATFAMKCVFIDRSNFRDSIDGIRRGETIIAKGHSMLVFPEGTRSKTGEIAPLKHGAFRLATESDAYVIPIIVKGTRQACEDRKKLFGKYDAYITLSTPIKMNKEDTREIKFDKIKKIDQDIRETFASLGDN